MSKLSREFKIVKKILYLNLLGFPFFAVTTISAILLESVTYTGFIKNHILLSPTIFFVLLVASAYFLVMGNTPSEKTKYQELLTKLTILISPALFLVGFIFLSLENSHYKGYVYTNGFHFDPVYFYYLYAIAFLIVLVDISRHKGIFGKYKITETPRIFLSMGIVSLFFYFIYANLRVDIGMTKPKIGAIIKNPTAGNVWKGRFLFADFYDYMMFVDKYTPDNAVIMRMKQQSKWPTISNDGYVRGFIYPRYTKVGDQNSLNDKSIGYIFINRAYGPPRVDKYIEKWPTFPVNAKKIIYMRDNDFTKDPIIVNGNYDPDNHQYDDLWGIIVLER